MTVLLSDKILIDALEEIKEGNLSYWEMKRLATKALTEYNASTKDGFAWDKLREEYFKYCVTDDFPNRRFNLTPHNLFEWFKGRINLFSAPESGGDEKVKKFLMWLGLQEEFQWDWNNKVWSENTGHDDFDQYTMYEMFEHWQQYIAPNKSNSDVTPEKHINDVAEYFSENEKEGQPLTPSSNSIEQEWISVKDELPKESGLLLICVEPTNDIYVSFYRKGRKVFEVWGAGRDLITDMKTTYWRPLLAPPNSEQEDKRSVATKSNQGDDAGNKKDFKFTQFPGKEGSDIHKPDEQEELKHILKLSKEEGKDEKDLEQTKIDYYEDKIEMLNRVHDQEIERLTGLIKKAYFINGYDGKTPAEMFNQFAKENGLK